MERSIFTFLFLFAFPLFILAENDKDIKGELKHVTVYPDRAQLIHQSSFELPSGKTILKLKGLSPYIDAQSIQVKGTGGFTILAVNLQNNFLQNLEDSPEVRTIRSQIEELQVKVEDENTALKTLQEKEDFLLANKAILVKETNFSIDQFKTMMELYTTNIDLVNNTVLRKTRLIKDYEKQIGILQKQINEKLGRQQLPSGEISVTVSSEKQVSGTLSFSYVVSNAGWYPSYDIRVDEINKPVIINYKANVYQNTGVIWKDVQLSFSNATPWIAGNAPVLNPWFIDFYSPIAIRGMGYGAVKSDAAPVFAKEAAATKAELVRNEAALPVIVEKKVGEMSVTFDVSLPYTIQADGKAQIIEIQSTTTPADYKYITIPKMSTIAYLTGNIADWAKQSLLSGEATLYFENTFVGKSFLNVNQINDTLTISLGPDNSILVKREKRKDFTSRKVVGSNKTETFSFLLTIRNNKASAIRITVSDQIPVSSNSSIVVEANELSGGMLNAETGTVKWDLDLKPQEKRELVLSYSVKYPKNQNIVLE